MSDLSTNREPRSTSDPRQPFHLDGGSLIAQCTEHRLEYVSSETGKDIYRCLNAFCGETVIELIDGIGG